MVKIQMLMPLLAATVRRVSWFHVVVPCLTAVVTVAVADRSQPGQPDLVVLRWAALLLVTALASAIEDGCESDLAATPTSTAATRTAALALALPPVALAWWVMLVLPTASLPWVALTAELAALLLLGTAAAGLTQRLQLSVPASLVALAPGGTVLLIAPLLRRQVALFAPPTDPVAWELAHGRWAVLALLGLTITVVSGLDPGRRRLHRMLAPVRPATPSRLAAGEPPKTATRPGISAHPHSPTETS